MATSAFNCSQANFIVVVQTGVNSFLQYLSDFTAFSPIYSQAWGDTLLADLATAAALPDEDARRSESEALRLILTKDSRSALDRWQRLKRYIANSFDKDLVYLKLKAAGANYYAAAANEGWPEALQLFTNALNFIEINKETMKDVMPESFINTFKEDVAKFKSSLGAYEQSKEAIMEGTQNRTKALNGLHVRFMPMLLDGQEIFRDNDAVRKQFVFTEILGRISGPGLAGVRGNVTNSSNNAPLENALVSITDSGGKAVASTSTDAEGKFLANTPSGTYTIAVVANGFVPRTIDDFTVDIGTVSKLDVALSAMMPDSEG